MNSRRPTTAGIDQLSLNLIVTRSPDASVLVSVLLWSPDALGGVVESAILLGLAGCLEPLARRPNTEVWPFQSSAASEMEAVFLRQSRAHLLAEGPVKALAVVLALSRTALSEYWRLLPWQDPRARLLGGLSSSVAAQA